MKYIKTYEKNNTIDWSKVDYVKCLWKDKNLTENEVYKLLKTKSDIIEIKGKYLDIIKLRIKNDKGKISDYLRARFTPASTKEIEDYKIRKSMNKYNL